MAEESASEDLEGLTQELVPTEEEKKIMELFSNIFFFDSEKGLMRYVDVKPFGAGMKEEKVDPSEYESLLPAYNIS